MVQPGAALGLALHGTTLHLAVLDALRYEHLLRPPLVAVVATGTVRTGAALERRVRRLLAGEHLAVVHPHLHADGAHRGGGGAETVVDLRAQRVPVSYTHLDVYKRQ